jgi:hypothetical protein
VIRRLTRTLRVAGGAMRAYVARPDASDAPAVVVLHGEAGLDDRARAACDAIATLGCLAVCPDLFWRDPACGAPFDAPAAREDIAEVIDAIRRETLGDEGIAMIGLGPAGLAASFPVDEPDDVPWLRVDPTLLEPSTPDVSDPVRAWLEAQLPSS